jgi:hypothetical protein
MTSIKNIALAALVTGIFGLSIGGWTGWKAGSLSVTAEWHKEKSRVNAEAFEQIEQAHKKMRELEMAQVDALNKVENEYVAKLKQKDRERNRAIADARNNGLFINAQCPSGEDTVPQTAASSDSGNEGTSVRLPNALSESLIDLLSEADSIAEQLAACQAVIRSDRGQTGR